MTKDTTDRERARFAAEMAESFGDLRELGLIDEATHNVTVQTLTTESGEELVVLSRRDYDALLARLGEEDAEDRMTLVLAAEARAEAPLPDSVSAAVLRGDGLLRAIRNWRGLTQVQLAEGAGIGQGYLRELEARAKTGSVETLTKLARRLDVPTGWLG